MDRFFWDSTYAIRQHCFDQTQSYINESLIFILQAQFYDYAIFEFYFHTHNQLKCNTRYG